MEKAILKTLIYADIFDYPLKVWEIHKWLIGKKVNLWQAEKMVGKLRDKGRVLSIIRPSFGGKGYYLLPERNGIIRKRQIREKQSAKFLRKAKILAFMLKVIPWIKLVGVSGGLAMENASKSDDIDFFIITSKNRLWLSRLLVLGILSLIGQRRRATNKGKEFAGKICLNTLLEEDRLKQENKDIYTAHEVLQMKVLWERDGIYSKYLENNEWAFDFIPNWIANSDQELRITNLESRKKQKKHNSLFMLHDSPINQLEKLAKKFQLWYMQKPKGMERIQDGALYFHPKDYRKQILEEFEKRIKNLISP